MSRKLESGLGMILPNHTDLLNRIRREGTTGIGDPLLNSYRERLIQAQSTGRPVSRRFITHLRDNLGPQWLEIYEMWSKRKVTPNVSQPQV